MTFANKKLHLARCPSPLLISVIVSLLEMSAKGQESGSYSKWAVVNSKAVVVSKQL